MANTASAKKRARQADKRRAHNTTQRSTFRTSIKKVLTAIASGDKTAAEAAYRRAVPLIDQAASKGLIHTNKAARHKSRLLTRIRAIT